MKGKFFWIDLATGLSGAAIMAGFARRRSTFSRLLSSRMPGWLGQSSYSLYLIHAPILEVILFAIVVPLGLSANGLFLAALLLVVPICVRAARGFWTLFELPFMPAFRRHDLRRTTSRSFCPSSPALAPAGIIRCTASPHVGPCGEPAPAGVGAGYSIVRHSRAVGGLRNEGLHSVQAISQ